MDIEIERDGWMDRKKERQARRREEGKNGKEGVGGKEGGRERKEL